jgi:methylated-DNA-[protein]-cysteine S-methyltransferase
MRPKPLRYEAPGFGVGEVWLDEDGRVFHSELPRPGREPLGLAHRHPLVRRLRAFFAGRPESFDGVDLVPAEGFYAACVAALRRVGWGEVVTYGELAALAGRPGAARAAGTFCGRCDLSPFVPTHRVVSAGGIGSYGDLGVDYKRRLLELEGVRL